ncbi:deoxynucleotidyltransferase terminal-interacting protein 2 [Mastacembelus armatus]|uniref:Deoxynucleotidyltransferase, terminal, interacting protein 2 n=1 Tax=Mastacembelus armatus TaxID=205130 RepID=A0A3Q3RP20_9TELE|nr:deoxynucleotidyltransferase terminal-interacting protein 2 [Mastacembelus armatus]
MVATRRGGRVESPTKTNPEQPSDVQATPSTGRITRRTAKLAESPAQHTLVETSKQLAKKEASSPLPSVRRCTRASRLHSPEQPSTPVGSTHEADVSDLESCCSVVSDIELPVTRSSRRRQPLGVRREEEEISEVESCSSAVSVSKPGRVSRRSTRIKTVPETSDPKAEDVKVNQVLETESCSSVASESKRVTRSQRKTACTRSSAKQQTEDSEVSDADSCMSGVSGADVSKSTTRRTTRSVRRTGPIPMYLDEASESPHSPASTGRPSRAARGKAAVGADTSEPQSCESDGFESGPANSMTTPRQGKTQSRAPKSMYSDSELMDTHSQKGSPCSTRDTGTPCSSRTGSGNSHSVKDLSVVEEKVGEATKDDSSLSDSRLESTVIAEDADCTLLEEDGSQTPNLVPDEGDTKQAEKAVNVISEEDSHVSVSDGPECAESSVSEPAVSTTVQQEEPSAENKDGDTLEMEEMQEMIPSSEPLEPCQSVIATTNDRASEIMKEEDKGMEVADVDTPSSQASEAVGEDAVVETRPSVVEKMEVSTLSTDAQQVVDTCENQVTAIQVTSSQRITADSDSDEKPRDIIVQNRKGISLLESSDDEDEYAEEEEEEGESSGAEEEEDLGDMEEERAGPSKKSGIAGTSVEGLFVIDTRPGQEADEHYYKEAPTEEAEQEEQDEEFVDEEGDEDDDDEDAQILFSSRNPQLKELSSRIDPGIRVKELGGLYINFDGSKSKPVSSSLQKLKEKKIQDEVMKKSVIGPDFEKKDAVPPYSESKQALKLKRKAEREKSTGDGWFNMKAPELTQELKGDLQVLKMRGSMDSKRFYKKNDRDGFPKYFQIGTVEDSAVDFYHSRIPKKQRKRTMVEELLADAEFRHNNKKKYQHILMEKAAQKAGKKSKKNQFHKK